MSSLGGGAIVHVKRSFALTAPRRVPVPPPRVLIGRRAASLRTRWSRALYSYVHGVPPPSRTHGSGPTTLALFPFVGWPEFIRVPIIHENHTVAFVPFFSDKRKDRFVRSLVTTHFSTFPGPGRKLSDHVPTSGRRSSGRDGGQTSFRQRASWVITIALLCAYNTWNIQNAHWYVETYLKRTWTMGGKISGAIHFGNNFCV